ncbi:hypothetical protein LEMLEM_LOCUS24289 [Lemmus lemmus]
MGLVKGDLSCRSPRQSNPARGMLSCLEWIFRPQLNLCKHPQTHPEARRGHQTSLQMVVSHHVVAGN